MNIIWPKALVTTKTGSAPVPRNPTVVVTLPRTAPLTLTLHATAAGNLLNLPGLKPRKFPLLGNNKITLWFYLLRLPPMVVTLCTVRPAGLRCVLRIVIIQQLWLAAVNRSALLLPLVCPNPPLEPKPLTIRILLRSLCTLSPTLSAPFGLMPKKDTLVSMSLPVTCALAISTQRFLLTESGPPNRVS